MNSLTTAYLLLMTLLLLRNLIVYRIFGQRIEEVHQACLRAIKSDATDPMACWRKFEQGPSQFRMVLDLRRWTYRQFYPEAA